MSDVLDRARRLLADLRSGQAIRPRRAEVIQLLGELERELADLRASVVAAMSSAGPEVGEDERAP